LLEHELAIAVFEAVKAGQERQPKQIVAQGLVWQHQGGDVANFQAADFHYIEPGGGGPHRAICGPDLGDKRILRRVDAKARGPTVSACSRVSRMADVFQIAVNMAHSL